jgi:hypothetical protein
MIKKFVVLFVVFLLMSGGCGIGWTEDTPTETPAVTPVENPVVTAPLNPPVAESEFTISLKQGFISTWKDWETKNITLVETMKTRPVESWGKWNALWDGWSLDLGYPFDNSTSKDIGLLIGRQFGTLGKYLPIDFPFKDKIVLTLYPFGLYGKNFLDFKDVHLKGASGVGYITGTLKF